MLARPFNSIGRKIALAIGLPLVVALLVALELSYRRAHEVVRHNAADEAAALAELVAQSFTFGAAADAPREAHAQVAGAMQADYGIWKNVRSLRVIDRNGVIRWSRNPEEVGTRSNEGSRLLAAPLHGAADVSAGEYVRPLGAESCARCHGGDAKRIGAVQAVIGRPRVEDELAGFYRGVLLFVAVTLVLLALASGALLHLFITRPLQRLTEAMRRAEQGDFLVRAKFEGRDEIARLAAAFNRMVSRITEMRVAQIETSREMESMQRELTLKAELERQHTVIEDANRALARRVREVTLLLDVSRSLNSSLALPEILATVTEMVGVTMGVDQFAVMLLEDGGQSLKVAASFGFKAESLGDFTIALGTGGSGLAATTREPVYIADVRTDPRYVRGPQDPEGDASVLCVPMIWKEQMVGVLNFVRFARGAFTENDIVLLQLVGGQAAMAIVNGRLYSETVALTLTDPLTGLSNRRQLFSRLEMEMSRSQRFENAFSVLMIDIDHFKHLNDTCGHPVGDQVLRQLAELLRATVRKVDTVARYGGEEFMILLPRSDRAEGAEVAEKVRHAVEQTRFEGGSRQPGGRITISVGVASFPEDGGTMERLVDAVDSALYASKKGGRNRVTAYRLGMELSPGRERGPWAEVTGETKQAAS